MSISQELEHTKQYIRIELLRFGERLCVSYDIEDLDFEIPPLTIQPMVENAIKHGVCEKIEGGTVHIAIRSEEENYVIQIEDNGVGFDPTKKMQDGRTHIGIENVRKRVEQMVGGKLIVESQVDIGTSVWIKIPIVNRRV